MVKYRYNFVKVTNLPKIFKFLLILLILSFRVISSSSWYGKMHIEVIDFASIYRSKFNEALSSFGFNGYGKPNVMFLCSFKLASLPVQMLQVLT